MDANENPSYGDGGSRGDDGRPPTACEPPSNLKRGNTWVRENPMFISALTVRLPAPSKAVVDDYFDLFGANAAHLWAMGLPTRMAGWAAAAAERSDFRWLVWTMSNGLSGDGSVPVDGFAASTPGRIGYQVGDEPGTWQAYYDTVAGIEVVRAADPDALVFMNFSHPNDIIDAMLDDYGSKDLGDIVSFDTYNDGKGAYRFMTTFREKALKYELPYWCYLRLYRSGSDSFWKEEDMRWSAFAHALFGYTGYSWFIYQIDANDEGLVPAGFSEVGNFESTKTERYSWAAGLNAELKNLGRALTVLTSTDIRWVADSSLLLPPDIEMWAQGAGNNPYIIGVSTPGNLEEVSLGFFDDDCGEKYVMVQNVNHPGASFPIGNTNELTINIDFDFTGAAEPGLDKTQVQYLDKATGQIQTMALASQGDADLQRLSVTLPAGDVFFFKYKTNQGFALQQL